MSSDNVNGVFLDCQEGCPNAIGVYSGFDGEKVFSGVIRCGSWTCPFCGPRKLKQLRKRLHDGEITQQAISRYGAKFATLTFGGKESRSQFVIYESAKKNIFPDSDPDVYASEWEKNFLNEYIFPDPDPDVYKSNWEKNRFQPQTTKYYNRKVGQMITGPRYDLTAMYDFMMAAFNKLRTALMKRFGKFMYFRIYEPHLDGVPHLHVLFVGESVIPKNFIEAIQKLWAKYGLGFVRLNVIRDKNGKVIKNFKGVKHAVNYLLKYMTKGVKKAGRYRRVFSCSQKTLMPLSKKDWKSMKIIMGVVNDEGNDFVEEVIYSGDDPVYEFENGLYGSDEELREAERIKGHVEFVGENGGDFVRVPADIVGAIQEIHISKLTQNTINNNRGHYS